MTCALPNTGGEMRPEPDWSQVLGSLARLYREVDQETHRLSEVHRPRLQCRRGCASCCVDNGVFSTEVKACGSDELGEYVAMVPSGCTHSDVTNRHRSPAYQTPRRPGPRCSSMITLRCSGSTESQPQLATVSTTKVNDAFRLP